MSEPRLIYGCMRLGDSDRQAFAVLDAAVEAGIRRFDLADIYGGGDSERRVGRWLAANPGLRAQLLLTTKCGVRLPGNNATDGPARYNLDGGHLRQCVAGSLERLGVDSLDVLLLHRPDYLAEVNETAATLARLIRDGAVAAVGVSNYRPWQLESLENALGASVAVHQLELNLADTSALDDGRLPANADGPCRIEAWGPLRGVVSGRSDPRWTGSTAARVGSALAALAKRYGCEPTQLPLAWIGRHPAGIWPVIGTTQPERIRAAVAAMSLELTRADWYALLEAARGRRVP